jgi:hypothetical protein
MVSYLPANQQTLHVYQHCRWRPETRSVGASTMQLFT